MSALNKPTSEKLEPIAAGVARSLALGLDYEDIAAQFGMTLDQVAKVARGNLVKKRTKEIVKEIDLQLVEDAAANPVTQYLKGKSLSAAKILVAEAENYDKEDQGATASTRIAASKEVLALAGHKAQTQETGASTVIMISADKVSLGKTIIEKTASIMPDFVDG